MLSTPLILGILVSFATPFALALPSVPQNLPVLGLENVKSPMNTSSLLNPTAPPEHPVDCFDPTYVILPRAAESDCNHIIQDIILRLPNVQEEQTFGFNPTANIHLPQDANWSYGQCAILVDNGDKSSIGTFRFLDVALTARRISDKCVVESETSIGGTAYVGEHVPGFYVAVGGANRGLLGLEATTSVSKRGSSSYQGSKPLGRTLALAERGSPSTTESLLASIKSTRTIGVPPQHSIDCFDRTGIALKPAVAEDCNFVINQYLLRLPNPMQEQTFGYTDAADINLSIMKNREWFHGKCVILIDNDDETQTDIFRPVDLAVTAQRINKKCVTDAKEPVGGTAFVGSYMKSFYVSVGGLVMPKSSANETTLSLPLSEAPRGL